MVDMMEAKRLALSPMQNSHVTYDGRSEPRSPDETAQMVTAYRHRYGVDRMAISGGEPTLNRKWLHACVFVLKDSNGIEKWGICGRHLHVYVCAGAYT